MHFIGRSEELAFLDSCYQSSKAQLVFLYGRRRVGKTETLREFCKKKEHVFFSAQEATSSEQLATFSQRMFEEGTAASRYLSSYRTWEDAFSDIPQLPFSGKKLVIFDEFPYVVRRDSAIPSMLQNLWDGKLKDENIMIVFCGSAMSFIEKELLAEKNPLFGRATGILKMNPMPFWDAGRFFPHYTAQEKIVAFSILGGIPHYLSQFDPELSIAENIQHSILRKGSVLYSEVEFLMHQEFRETSTYNSVIQAVALGATQLNEIAQKTLIDKQKLSVYLKNLIEVGIVEREFSVDQSIKIQAKGQRGLYRLSDNFFRFWYAFVFSNKSDLEISDVHGVYKHQVQPALNEFSSIPFEQVCTSWVRKQNKDEALPFRCNSLGRWWNKAVEIEILGKNAQEGRYLLGECKFTNTQIGMREKTLLEKKRELFPVGKHDLYFFSKSGFSDALIEAASADNALHLVTAEELYQ